MITNTASSKCPDEDSIAGITVKNTASLTIAKAIYPINVSCGERVSYTFIIQNTGNTTVSEGVAVSDSFTPPISELKVTLNSEPFPVASYTYD